MRRRSSSLSSRRSSTLRRRSDNLRFDEFGFAILTKRKEHKLHHRCHNYSYPPMSAVRMKELCELLSYWNGASFICRSQIERFIRMGIPPSLRGRVWKCLLSIDRLKERSDFNYQKCLLEVRRPLVDLGVSEYGILSAIATLSETQNDLGSNPQPPSSGCPEPSYSVDDITLFRQIALDLQRSFPTHRSLMGERPEAIEGQAKLFRVLIAYAKYNPRVGYSQGMSYIAAVLLMQLLEEEAFWTLTALLDEPKHLNQLYDLDLTKVQHQVKVFHQFLKHRKPKLSQHLESVGVFPVHYVTPWFLTLFSSLPCWDSVLAVWDLIILHGLAAAFGAALTIVDLLEPRLMQLTEEGAALTLLLRVPVDVAQYTVLVPALWRIEVQDWELKCMSNLVLDENHHGTGADPGEKQDDPMSTQVLEREERENTPAPLDGQKKPRSNDSSSKAGGLLARVTRLARRYLLEPIVRQGAERKGSQTQTKPKQRSSGPGRVLRSRTSASLTQAQVRSGRQSRRRAAAQRPAAQEEASGDVISTDAAGSLLTDRSAQSFNRTGTGPARRWVPPLSSHSLLLPPRSKPLHLRSGKNRTPSSSPLLPSSDRSSPLPPSSPIPSATPPLWSGTRRGEQQEQRDAARTALVKELSSRRQTNVPLRTGRESRLI